MSKPQPIERAEASRKVRAVFDDIKKTRQVADVNNFWKYLANDPALLERTWKSLKEVMAPGALDPLTKEMIYLAVSVTNGCGYCTASHSAAARKAGMTQAMFGELMGVVGMANADQSPLRRLPRAHRSGLRVSCATFHRSTNALRQRNRRRPVEQRTDAANIELERIEQTLSIPRPPDRAERRPHQHRRHIRHPNAPPERLADQARESGGGGGLAHRLRGRSGWQRADARQPAPQRRPGCRCR